MSDNEYGMLELTLPLTVTTVDMNYPDEKWIPVRCDYSFNKTFTFLAYDSGGFIYLKPDKIYPTREWEDIFDFDFNAVDFDKDRTVRIKSKATLICPSDKLIR